MHVTKLKKIGGSVMLVVPPAILERLKLSAGAPVGLEVADGRLVVDPQTRPKYTMDELLAASDYSQPEAQMDREWLDAPPVGREII